jgi:hypothetical protein
LSRFAFFASFAALREQDLVLRFPEACFLRLFLGPEVDPVLFTHFAVIGLSRQMIDAQLMLPMITPRGGPTTRAFPAVPDTEAGCPRRAFGCRNSQIAKENLPYHRTSSVDSRRP